MLRRRDTKQGMVWLLIGTIRHSSQAFHPAFQQVFLKSRVRSNLIDPCHPCPWARGNAKRPLQAIPRRPKSSGAAASFTKGSKGGRPKNGKPKDGSPKRTPGKSPSGKRRPSEKLSTRQDLRANRQTDEFSYATQSLKMHPSQLNEPAPDLMLTASNTNHPRIVTEIPLKSNRNENETDDDAPTKSMNYDKAYLIDKPIGWTIFKGKISKGRKSAGSTRNKDAAVVGEETFDFDEQSLKALVTPEEWAAMGEDDISGREESEHVLEDEGQSVKDGMACITTQEERDAMTLAGLDPLVVTGNNLAAKLVLTSNEEEGYNAIPSVTASLTKNSGPVYDAPHDLSVMNWLKSYLAEQGRPVRGGTKYWTAIAGATDACDSGLVLLCPKQQAKTVEIIKTTYWCGVGTGGKLATASSGSKGTSLNQNGILVTDVTSERGDGPRSVAGRVENHEARIINAAISGQQSLCSDSIHLVQHRYNDGVRGDASAAPLDRRAARRLIHCHTIEVKAAAAKFEGTSDKIPDDIAVLSLPRDSSSTESLFQNGSFRGRAGLQQDPLTNTYREINGAGDGYPGWYVDRYDKWLFVKHDEDARGRGPLPTVDGTYTKGIYVYEGRADRSSLGSEKIVPILVSGEPAPPDLTVLENGVKYAVSLGDQMSTGMWLDQRPQRAWLRQHCHEDTRILNCFAHAGAFSVAAACAGASTVSLDLDKKWLDRISLSMASNAIDFHQESTEGTKRLHDAIYGDCFEWLARLSKRAEQYDIVILDPPSTSVGKKKKRWNVKKDYASLVELAAPLVKRDGGQLWTTNNSATLAPDSFAKMITLGLDVVVGSGNYELDRVCPMPLDFPSMNGPQPVTNFVWTIKKNN
jgi:23S rRNA G2069 N7-methylase RlmK/C1962 C5-methylase RlmI